MQEVYSELILATSNYHKIREYKEMLKSLPCRFDLLSLHQFPDYIPPDETGHSFKENAVLKATHAAKTLQRWVLADDSGLIVSALQGAPGVLSKRYGGINATDGDNRKKLLENLKSFSSLEQRHAYYECCIVLANPQGMQKCVTGTCEGYISFEERGRNGFGYDPIFIKHDYEKTFGEIDESIKNRISHRRKAFERISIFLETIK